MSEESATLRVLVICLALLLCGDFAHSNAQRRKRHRHKKSAPTAIASDVDEQPEATGPPRINLKLADGTRITVDEAWESEQGIWYRQGGLTHLVTRDRAAGIEKTATAVPKSERQIAKV